MEQQRRRELGNAEDIGPINGSRIIPWSMQVKKHVSKETRRVDALMDMRRTITIWEMRRAEMARREVQRVTNQLVRIRGEVKKADEAERKVREMEMTRPEAKRPEEPRKEVRVAQEVKKDVKKSEEVRGGIKQEVRKRRGEGV
ncbi:uncharacterized protein DFL_000818 [Arthrobotrys flagrans]|uniref:Uncharacterized protein n=1 Tax=Arthrobotrys flagrans TaxID=97331 RepID=A0A437AF86_ARTFL|nr:hypothetical protein DFL_000818 [Arthrobotrys flagrans]